MTKLEVIARIKSIPKGLLSGLQIEALDNVIKSLEQGQSLDVYSSGYHAGYDQAKRDMKKEDSYKRAYKDALDKVQGFISIELAKANIGRTKESNK